MVVCTFMAAYRDCWTHKGWKKQGPQWGARAGTHLSHGLSTHTHSEAGTAIGCYSEWNPHPHPPPQRFEWRPAALREKVERSSTLCKCPLMRCEWQPGESHTCMFCIPQTQKHRGVGSGIIVRKDIKKKFSINRKRTTLCIITHFASFCLTQAK